MMAYRPYEWRKKNQERVKGYYKRYRLQRTFWTQERLDEFWAASGGECEICGEQMIPEGNARKSVALDHDHPEQKPRGLICNQCNVWLGGFEKHSQAMVDYLRKYGKTII